MNTGAPWPSLDEAEARVLAMQTKLHHWAKVDPGRRFDDVFNLVYDPAFLTVAWRRVRGNKGARTAGIDGVVPRSVGIGAARLLGRLREDLKARRFVPQRVREKTIPKAGGKVRALGIPTPASYCTSCKTASGFSRGLQIREEFRTQVRKASFVSSSKVIQYGEPWLRRRAVITPRSIQ